MSLSLHNLSMWQEDTIQIKRGDIWQLGEHKLMCADSTCVEDVARLFNGERFALCFTSPPYSDQRTYKLGEFDWHALMCGAFDQMIVHGEPDCHILINLGLSHKNRQVDMYWLGWLMHCNEIGWPVFGWYTWDKGAGMPGEWYGRLAPAYEFIFHFNQQSRHANKWIPTSVERGCRTFREKDGSTRRAHSPDKIAQPYKIPDAVIRINREKARGIQDNHPAVFPVALPEFIMNTWSQPHDIVYEPFCGSGTSLIAGSNLNRRVYAIDIEPSYCQLAIQRWQQHTGQRAVRIEIVEEVA